MYYSRLFNEASDLTTILNTEQNFKFQIFIFSSSKDDRQTIKIHLKLINPKRILYFNKISKCTKNIVTNFQLIYKIYCTFFCIIKHILRSHHYKPWKTIYTSENNFTRDKIYYDDDAIDIFIVQVDSLRLLYFLCDFYRQHHNNNI